jgi:hypothetical protein
MQNLPQHITEPQESGIEQMTERREDWYRGVDIYPGGVYKTDVGQTFRKERVMDAKNGSSLNRLAFSATVHCLTGCAIGEVLGMVIGTALGWDNVATIALAVVLAFFFGYSLTMVPLLRANVALASAIPLAFASDTLSITIMEIVDNLIMVVIPGAMDAGLLSLLFWGSLVVALAVAFVAAFPVNRWLIARGKGHAVVHEYHHGGDHGGHERHGH